MKISRTRSVVLFLVLICTLSLILAARGGKKDPVQQFQDAVAEFAGRTAYHVTYTDLYGETADSLEPNSITEIWHAGENWAQVSRNPRGGLDTWHLNIDGSQYIKIEMDNGGVWEPETGFSETVFLSKSLLDQDHEYTLLSCDQDGSETVICVLAGQAWSNEYSDNTPATLTARLDARGRLLSLTTEYRTDVKAHDGFEAGTIYTKFLVEIAQGKDSEISGYLNDLKAEIEGGT